MIDIDKLIMETMKSGDRTALDTYKLVKAKFLEFKTAKNAKPLDEIAQMQILNKMVKERKESAAIYSENGRQDLADKELAEIGVIEKLLPKPVTEDEIKAKIESHIELGIEPSMKNMGTIIKCVKEAYPNADGATVSRLVKERIGK